MLERIKVRLVICYQARNVTMPSGDPLGEPLSSQTEIEFETDKENLQREIVTRLLSLGDDDCRVTGYEVWSLLQEGPWDEQFKTPEISPETLAKLRAILHRRQR